MTNSIDPENFAADVSASVSSWMSSMAIEPDGYRFKFCARRGLPPTAGHKGHFVTCFAAKAAFHIGDWDKWPDARREAALGFIKSFQEQDGRFVDGWVKRHSVLGTYLGHLKRRRISGLLRNPRKIVRDAIRAETRQSAVTLLNLGTKPDVALPLVASDAAGISDFLESLDWSNPWAAGSHASHLISFLIINRTYFAVGDTYDDLVETAFQITDSKLHESTGAWGTEQATPTQRINGAMKMLTAYRWAEREIPYPQKLVDFALSNDLDEDGCGVLDRLFVLHQAGLQTLQYRQGEVEHMALEGLSHISTFRQPDGGFSFYLDHAQREYYGAIVSMGGAQSDMHGTIILTWAAALCFELLGIREDVGWNLTQP